MPKKIPQQFRRPSRRWLWMMVAFMAVGLMGTYWPNGVFADSESAHGGWQPFSFLTDPSFTTFERVALIFNIVVAFCGLAYAFWLGKFVYGSPTGTRAMEEIARAVREGADAYLFRQFRVV